MWWNRLFGRNKNQEQPTTGSSDTFREATGGGWGDPPETIASDGGDQKDFVETLLEQAQQQARESVEIGESFDFAITNIPNGIAGPHEIVFGLMMQSSRYGLSCGVVTNESANFTRRE
ncbi:MAG TPA: hypothetical protein VFM68_00070 [Candidatus Saccharimonadales bacterium]|nr:hypothetical protein [Candidatus Saccharimonadales bacterium]